MSQEILPCMLVQLFALFYWAWTLRRLYSSVWIVSCNLISCKDLSWSCCCKLCCSDQTYFYEWICLKCVHKNPVYSYVYQAKMTICCSHLACWVNIILCKVSGIWTVFCRGSHYFLTLSTNGLFVSP